MRKIKFSKRIIAFSLTIFAIAPIAISTSSCVEATPNRQIKDEHFEFINKLEFSLSGSKASSPTTTSFSLGTAWVYQALGTVGVDYKYRMITNYHVYKGFEDYTNFHYGFNEYDEMNSQISLQQIYMSPIRGQTSEKLNPFFIKTAIGGKETYLDICAIDIDFKESISSSIRLKTKLDAIDEIAKTNAGNFTINISPNKNGHNGQQVYFAGYPWKTSDNVQRNYTYFAEWYDNVNQLQTNSLNRLSNETYDTYQDQYWLPSYNNFPLGSGASGSLLINESNEAIGIYWGGRSNSIQFTPSAALFYMGNPITDSSGKKFEIDFFYQLNNRT